MRIEKQKTEKTDDRPVWSNSIPALQYEVIEFRRSQAVRNAAKKKSDAHSKATDLSDAAEMALDKVKRRAALDKIDAGERKKAALDQAELKYKESIGGGGNSEGQIATFGALRDQETVQAGATHEIEVAKIDSTVEQAEAAVTQAKVLLKQAKAEADQTEIAEQAVANYAFYKAMLDAVEKVSK